MTSPNIGYHTRSIGNNAEKIVGGSFGGSFSLETVNRLVNSHFNVVIKNSGRAVFVDKQNREVDLYLSIDAKSTEKGSSALKQWQKAENSRLESENEKLDSLLSKFSYEEIIRRLED
jgi:hypothetical protein